PVFAFLFFNEFFPDQGFGLRCIPFRVNQFPWLFSACISSMRPVVFCKPCPRILGRTYIIGAVSFRLEDVDIICHIQKKPSFPKAFAEWTGLEPATSCEI